MNFSSSIRFRRWSIILALSLASATPTTMAIAKDASTIAIDYHVRRLPAADRYEITMRFRGEHSGRSTLTIPSQWASAAHAERSIEGLEVLTSGARLEDTDAPQVKRIVHRPDEMLTVRYRLKQIADGPPAATAQTQFLPVIQPTYFAWIGWTTWVIPMADNDHRVRIHLAFAGLPSDWAFASSYGLDAAAVDFDGRMDGFQSALFIGGDFRLRSRPARGGPVITAMRGDWSFGDNALADRVAKIVDGERAFWSDDTQKSFLIALLPLAAPPGWRSHTGTGLSQSFVTYITSDTQLDELDGLWTHEYFHTWNYEQLGEFVQPEARLYWFSEGFTDYYTNLLQLRFGLTTLEQYAKAYDEAIGFLAESPDAHAPNSEVVKRFFTEGRTIGRLPYVRGMLLAAQWNAKIRAASEGRRSLDDAMRTLLDQHRQGVDVLDAPRIVRVMQSYGVTDAETDIDAQIERGDMPRLPDDMLGPCISLADASRPRVDIGFDLPGSTTGKSPIVGVDPDGPAYAAGLRDGQYLRTFSSVDRSEHIVEAGFQKTPDGPLETIRYRALGRPQVRQHAMVRTDLGEDGRRRCLRDLGVP